jgi:hypothetical protein
MALKGNLRDFSTTQLLNLVNLAKKTGMLTVDGQSENVILYFKEGRLIRASSDADSVHLVTMLQKTGKLAKDQAEAVNSQSGSSSDRVIGKYLMDAKLVSRDDIIQGVKEYILGIVYDLFTWVEGDFFFEQDALPANDRITIPLNLDNVILEGTRRIQQNKELEEELPDLSTIALKITDKPLRDVKLTQDDWRVISHIHPRNSVKQIAQNNNMDEYQIRKIVYGMLQAGLVQLITPEGLEQREAHATRSRSGRKAASLRQSPAEKRSVVTKLIERIKRI